MYYNLFNSKPLYDPKIYMIQYYKPLRQKIITKNINSLHGKIVSAFGILKKHKTKLDR